MCPMRCLGQLKRATCFSWAAERIVEINRSESQCWIGRERTPHTWGCCFLVFFSFSFCAGSELQPQTQNTRVFACSEKNSSLFFLFSFMSWSFRHRFLCSQSLKGWEKCRSCLPAALSSTSQILFPPSACSAEKWLFWEEINCWWRWTRRQQRKRGRKSGYPWFRAASRSQGVLSHLVRGMWKWNRNRSRKKDEMVCKSSADNRKKTEKLSSVSSKLFHRRLSKIKYRINNKK